ncbi:ribonuclease HII [Streptobacillus moniliformis]|uniref:Ribonuclease HII n=1 Tax=Streptobacillus moniliformis (strain ATCC 14647 / DSM 12112 / NCTC 10651 / 9901) TaxID=519441 RepID=D1AWZ2_STRM9|nr:ribonuclease HII [Streptobacillus moniliformis]ACZ00818.1 Ribonuclease H [Streptobacillus moniliformis DSM 12112]AVL42786.1 ribonuclease HII [Streptobacillus moniliformis]SQA14047.1 Ribonuclease HII [Streptobacillus moniliformis]
MLWKFDKSFKRRIIGVDEAGRGPLAGPVVAACVCINKYSKKLEELNDSKKLTDKKRRELFNYLTTNDDIKIGVGIVDEKVIDEINILNATFLAMNNALDNMEKDEKDLVLVDGNKEIKGYLGKQEAIVKGDGKSLSIAAASIIAKVTRDNIMEEYDLIYPGYEFAKHKGYGTKMHYECIKEKGRCYIHRLSFLKNLYKK